MADIVAPKNSKKLTDDGSIGGGVRSCDGAALRCAFEVPKKPEGTPDVERKDTYDVYDGPEIYYPPLKGNP